LVKVDEMKTKWIIEGLPDYRVGEDGNIYRLSFQSGLKWYAPRLIKEQYPQRFRLNNSWWTKKQLRGRLKRDESPVIIFEQKSDCPF
jgi:hypothetical protein